MTWQPELMFAEPETHRRPTIYFVLSCNSHEHCIRKHRRHQIRLVFQSVLQDLHYDEQLSMHRQADP